MQGFLHDTINSIRSRLSLLESAPGSHPDLAAHDVLGLATQTELNVHLHDLLYSALGHTHAGGLVTMGETEIDFGASPMVAKKFTVTDVTVTAGTVLTAYQSGKAATSKSADENEMDPLFLSAVPGAGQFTLYAEGLHGRVYGAFKIAYVKG